MRDSKVLITGGLGFIGLHLAELLVNEGQSVFLLDNLSPQVHGAVPDLAGLRLLRDDRVRVWRGDVRQQQDWEQLLAEVDYVVHLAAETGTAQSMYEISRYSGTNVSGTAMLLDQLANRRHNVRKIVLASSRAVYGEGAYECVTCGVVYPPARSEEMLRSAQWEPTCTACNGPIHAIATPEHARLAPVSIYGVTKLTQEYMVQIAARAHGIPSVVLRLQNVYGEGQSLRNPYTGILSIFSNQLRLGKPLNIFEDGRESRDFIHVADAARACLLALFSDEADGCVLNVGSGQAISVMAIAEMLRTILGSSVPIEISGQYRIGDIRHGFAEVSAIGERLGFTHDVPLEQGLEHFVEWVKKQPVEPDSLEAARQELMTRGLMPGRPAMASGGY